MATPKATVAPRAVAPVAPQNKGPAPKTPVRAAAPTAPAPVAEAPAEETAPTEPAPTIEELLQQLSEATEQGEKRKLRSKLRNLGHRGGLPAEMRPARAPKDEVTEEPAAEEAPAPAPVAAPAPKAGGRRAAK